MQGHRRRLRQIACLWHVVLAGAGAAALGRARDLGGPEAARYMTVFAIGIVCVLHVLHPRWPAARRQLTAWACALLVLAAAVALRWAPEAGARLGLIVVSACCLAGTLNAAACVWLWGPSGSRPRIFSGRVGLALFAGLLGLVPALAFRQAQALLPALLALSCLGCLAGGAGELEVALNRRDVAGAASVSAQLLTGTWLGMAAVAAASVAVSAPTLAGEAASEGALSAAVQAARLGWLHTFPLVGALFVVFAGRLDLAGLGARPSFWIWASVLGVTSAALGGARRELVQGAAGAVPPAPAEPAPAPVPGPKSQDIPPAPSTPAAAVPPETELALQAPAAGPADGGATGVPAPHTAGALTIEALATTGMLEADARSGLERRFKLLADCLETSGPPAPGTLALRAFVDASGSVKNVQPAGGSLEATPFSGCVMLAFYRIGFASQGSPASFEVTLRVSPKH